MKKNKKGKYIYERIAILILSILLIVLYLGGQHLTRERNKLYEENYNLKSDLEAISEDLEEAKANISYNDDNVEISPIKMSYRLTSYYTGDSTGSGSYVGAGINTSKFKVNSKGWYTYKGKLVVAAATYECLNSKSGACGKWTEELDYITYYHYYDEITIVIDGTSYEAIVLDSCGSCMTDKQNRIDLFVSNKDSVIDRGYKGINEVEVIFYE